MILLADITFPRPFTPARDEPLGVSGRLHQAETGDWYLVDELSGRIRAKTIPSTRTLPICGSLVVIKVSNSGADLGISQTRAEEKENVITWASAEKSWTYLHIYTA